MSKEDSEGRPLVETPHEALQRVENDYDAYRMLATFSFSVERKASALKEIEHTLRECERAVAATRSVGDGGVATEWRKVQEFLNAQRGELQMWLSLHEGAMRAAWSTLIEAQGHAHWAHRWLPDFEPAADIDQHLAEVERVIFPKQQFLSPSLIINQKDIDCTICNAPSTDCDHITGEIYDGEVAARLIKHVEGVREMSFVDDPANKYARVLSYGGIDPLTGEASSDPSST